MRKLLPLLVGSLALVAGSAQAKPADHEAELARAIAGRVAGPPVDCIDMHRVRSSHIIPGVAIVYDAGSTSTSTAARPARIDGSVGHHGQPALFVASCAASTPSS